MAVTFSNRNTYLALDNVNVFEHLYGATLEALTPGNPYYGMCLLWRDGFGGGVGGRGLLPSTKAKLVASKYSYVVFVILVLVRVDVVLMLLVLVLLKVPSIA